VATVADGSACRCGVDAGMLDGAPFSAAMAWQAGIRFEEPQPSTT